MTRTLLSATFAAVMLTAVATPASAHAQQRESDAFSYTGAVSAGRTVHVRNVNGEIAVERSTSGQVEIRAEKRWRRGDPDDVRVVQTTSADGGLMVCALWNDAECTADGIRGTYNRRNNDRNDVSVHFTVRVPDGVHVNMQTVNGGVEIANVSGMVDAATVNGNIDARSAGGPVHAKTVNGSIRASMGALGSDDLRYSTVNGGITIELPSNVNADLDVSTVNGSVNTDFPVTVQGTVSKRRLRGTIGSGGRALKASTVNGSVTLRRSN